MRASFKFFYVRCYSDCHWLLWMLCETIGSNYPRTYYYAIALSHYLIVNSFIYIKSNMQWFIWVDHVQEAAFFSSCTAQEAVHVRMAISGVEGKEVTRVFRHTACNIRVSLLSHWIYPRYQCAFCDWRRPQRAVWGQSEVVEESKSVNWSGVQMCHPYGMVKTKREINKRTCLEQFSFQPHLLQVLILSLEACYLFLRYHPSEIEYVDVYCAC